MSSEDNKRIAKNTLYLYARMLVFLFLGLLTSRVTLNALGIHDYGLLNVVGGVLGFLGYFSNLLAQGSSRFLTISLGRGDFEELKNTFSACLAIHIVIAIATLFIGETIGLWFVNNKLTIMPERMFAANCVYQLSIFSAAITIIQSPYTSSVISHEKMSTFAFMSIVDVVAKLIVVVLLLYVETDKLILYSSFYFCVSIMVFALYRTYCRRTFAECSDKLCWNPTLYKEMWNYVGWNSIGSFAFMANNQGITILLNMVFSTVVNAARGIANTVSNYVYNFVSNFMTAARPMIIKYYASGDIAEMNNLIINTAKYSAFLLLLIGLPVAIETPFLIHLWLGQVPEHVVTFVRITLVQLLFQAIDFPIGAGIHAVGRMKLPNLTSTFAYLSVLPLTYMAIKTGANPEIAYIISAGAFPVALCCDLWILHKYTGFEVLDYIKRVPAKVLPIIIISSIIPIGFHQHMEGGWIRLITVASLSVIISASTIYCIGLDISMRRKVIGVIKSKLHL